MQRNNRRDPYDGFKDDRERRLALNTRVRWWATAWALAALAGAPALRDGLRWLMHWLP